MRFSAKAAQEMFHGYVETFGSVVGAVGDFFPNTINQIVTDLPGFSDGRASLVALRRQAVVEISISSWICVFSVSAETAGFAVSLNLTF